MKRNGNPGVISKKIKRSALSVALGLCAIGSVYAQSNASGSIYGSAEPGSVIVVQNTGTGQTRSITVGSNGRYQLPALALGSYKVELRRDDQILATRDNVTVELGNGSQVSFASGDATLLDSVQVTSTNVPKIDVSSTDVRSVFNAEQLQKMPVGRSLNSIALLAPGVVRGDSRYDGVASFGGASVTENAYYINGYAVTNPLTFLGGSTELPFNGISQVQVLTSGYGAEFGRATGGVVNTVSQSGSNDIHYGFQTIWQPKSASRKNIYLPSVGLPLDGQLYRNMDDYEDSQVTYGTYISGPLVKDRLFFFASGEYQRRDTDSPQARAGSTAGFYNYDYTTPRGLLKLDWNINDNHSVELTAVSDRERRTEKTFAYAYTQSVLDSNNAATNDNVGLLQRGNVRTGGGNYEEGGELYIGKYTGYLTEDLILTALYGRQKTIRSRAPWGYDPNVTYVSGSPSAGADPIRFGTVAQLEDPGAFDRTKGGRLDLTWNIGNHSLRLGYDAQDSTSREGEQTAGPGYRWSYDYGTPGETIDGGNGALYPANGRFVEQVVYNNGGEFDTEQYAYYLEDRWQVSDKVLLSLGVRNENFENFNGDGISYLDGKNQWAPRLGITWDVFGDSTFKVFGNVGRYHLTVPNTVAQRGASGSTYTREYFSYAGIDPVTGIPQGTVSISPNGPYSANGEYGQAPNPDAVAATDLKPYYQDEAVLGFEAQLSANLTGGLRYVYRELGSMIDDICDPRAARDWGLENGFSPEESENLWFNNTSGCRMSNPGESNTYVLYDDAGNPHSAKLDMHFPKMVRKYHSVDLFLEHAFNNKWYGRIDYTWSHNYGNGEGMTNSDIGQDVAQAAATQSWDHLEQAENASGNLPNDRRHQIKAFGFYQLTPEWLVSSTLVAASGRPKNCTGYYNGVNADDEYTTLNILYPGPYYWFCNNEASPRGSRGTLPWSVSWDLGVAYTPSIVSEGKLEFRLDMFNVLNRQSTQNVIEYGENGGPGVPYQFTGRVITYSAPRSLRLSARYDF